MSNAMDAETGAGLEEACPDVTSSTSTPPAAASASQVSLSRNASNTSLPPHRSRPEILHDSEPPSVFVDGMACVLESIERSSRDEGTVATDGRRPNGIEEIHSDEAEAPIPPGAAEELIDDDSAVPSDKRGHSKKIEGKSVEIVDEDVCPPAPFPFEEYAVIEKKSKTEPEPVVADDLEMGTETPSNNEDGDAGSSLQLDSDSLDDHVGPTGTDCHVSSVGTGSSHTTDEAEASSLPHIPHAFLVPQGDGDGTVYDAIRITDPVPDEPLPWWKRHRNLIGAVSVISVAILIAVVAGSTIALIPRDNEAAGLTPQSSDSTSIELTPQALPNQSPTSPSPTSYLPLPPPTANDTSVESMSQVLPSWSSISLPPPNINCTVENFGPLYNDSECQSCYRVGRDGMSLISIKNDMDRGKGAEIQVLSDINGSLQIPAPYTLGDIGNGFALAFSANLIFTGNPFDSNGGTVYVTPKHSSGSSNEIVAIRPAPENMDPLGYFGFSIAVDGDVLVVGAPHSLGLSGAAFIFRQTYAGWVEEAKLEPPDLGNQTFGNSVLVKGNLVIVAAAYYGDEDEGAVFFYEFDASSKSWEPLANNTLVNDDCSESFGTGLGFTSDDGLLIGCPMENDNQGAVYYYQRSDSSHGQYIFQQKITTEDANPYLWFGGNNKHFAISEDGSMFAAGTNGDENGAYGRVHIFAKINNVWLEVAKIDQPEDSTYFGGESTAIDANWLLVASQENTYSYKLTCSD